MLWRKLWADSRALARQTIALMVLIGLGVMLFGGLNGAYRNLTGIYNHVYESARLADASVLFDRGPEGLIDKASTIPHVRAAMGRAVRDGAIIQRGRDRERVLGRFVACPRGERSSINDIMVFDGRYLANPDEAVLEHQFAFENGYKLGDRITCVHQLREREFTIVGFAVSPEYIYPVPSKHELFVSRGTFGVLFIEEDRARDWFGLGRQITEVHCLTDPGYEAEVLAKLEGIAHPFGVETSYVQDDQPSKRLLAMDQQGFAQMSVFFPILFLSAAGLSLYGALSRIVRLQVTVIGTLRACGFGRREILLQYVTQGLLVAVAGALPGVALGHWLAVWLTVLYADALHLPVVLTPIRWDTITTGLLLAAGTGLVSAYLPARSAARLEPAVAMRGEAEAPGRLVAEQRLVEWTEWARVVYRIPIRGVVRRASRTLLALAGIAGGASIMMTTLGIHISTMDAIDDFLTRTRKYEIDLQFSHPSGLPLARAAVAALGGGSVCPTASLPVRVSSSWGSGELILTGLERGQRLLRPRTVSGAPLDVGPGSIWLPKQLAERLLVEPGDPVYVEWVRSTRKRRLSTTMRVAGMLDAAMGAAAYGEIEDVRRTFADAAYPHSGYGAFVACPTSRVEPVKHCLERAADVALVSTTGDVTEQINEQMALMYIMIGALLGFGSLLAGSVIHGVATVSLLERTRELATLRSLGFSARKTAWLAALELGALAALGLVVGLPLGAELNRAFISSFTTENMSFRAILPWWVYALTVLIVFGLAAFSSYRGMRYLQRLDLAQATKARE